MDSRKIIEILRGTIDPNLRQQAEDELTQVRKCGWRTVLLGVHVSRCRPILWASFSRAFPSPFLGWPAAVALPRKAGPFGMVLSRFLCVSASLSSYIFSSSPSPSRSPSSLYFSSVLSQFVIPFRGRSSGASLGTVFPLYLRLPFSCVRHRIILSSFSVSPRPLSPFALAPLFARHVVLASLIP